MSTKVSVNIYGQEYTISGEESQEKIIKVAAHVDSKMREIGGAVNSLSTSGVAVLSSVNISEEYFTAVEKADELKQVNEQLEGDIQHYIQLWDEAKKNFEEAKENNTNLLSERDSLKAKLVAKDKEIDKILEGQGSMQEEIEKGIEGKLNDAEAKYKDLENNFFDLQMENIRIKSELEKLRRNK